MTKKAIYFAISLLGMIAYSSLSEKEFEIKLAQRWGYYYFENKNEQKCTALSKFNSLMEWIIPH